MYFSDILVLLKNWSLHNHFRSFMFRPRYWF